jgi:thiol-disulfide isomerase/thioredoxin
MRLGSELPSFEGAYGWLSDAVARDDILGAPILVHFWSVSCYLCKGNYPTIRKWQEEFAEKGLRVVAVHMPRQEDDLDEQRVRDVVTQLGLTEPCALDNEHAIKDAFQNSDGWVPAYFLFTAEGVLKSRTAGDAGLTMMRSALEKLFSDG